MDSDKAASMVTTSYEQSAKRILALLMDKPQARQEFNAVFGDLNVADVFPDALVDVARWVLSVDYPITYQMVLQKTNIPFLDDFAFLTVFDKTPQGIVAHVSSFLDLYQTVELSRMGFQVDPHKPPLDQIEALTARLQELGQRRVQAKEARGDLRFSEVRKRLQVDDRQGFRPFGLQPLDAYLPGMNYLYGDMGVILGKEKTGKTRFALNLIIRALLLYPDLEVSWFSTEPFSSPEGIMLSIWAMLAARAATENGEAWDISDTAIGAVHDSRYMHYIEAAAELAQNIGTRLYIYGPALEDGNASQLTSAMSIMQRNLAILGHKVVVIDNFQQFTLPGSRINLGTDYELMLAVTRAISTLGAQHKVAMFGLSQVARQSNEVRGGGGINDRTAWALRPKPGKSVHSVTVHCDFARKAPGNWDIQLENRPFSGWLTGKPPERTERT